MKRLLTLILISAVFIGIYAAPTKKSSMAAEAAFKAEAISEPTLPGYVVYRPADYKAATKSEGRSRCSCLQTEVATIPRCPTSAC